VLFERDGSIGPVIAQYNARSFTGIRRMRREVRLVMLDSPKSPCYLFAEAIAHRFQWGASAPRVYQFAAAA